MINLSEAPEQKDGVKGPVPPKSIVKVKMEIRQPKKPDASDPAVTVFKSGLKGLDCEFTIIGGQFDGVRIWENIFLPPGMQSITLTKGQTGACNSGFSKARAIVEAARNLDPADPAANRTIQSWFDLHGLTFPVKVGIDTPKPGDLYINNNILKIITMADEHYAEVMAGGEVVTSEPIPEIPAATASAPPAQPGAAWWGGAKDPQASAPATNTPPTPSNVPAWAK